MTDDNENGETLEERAHRKGLGVDEGPLIKPQKQSFLVGLRSNFLAGIVVAAPISITIALVYWFLDGPNGETRCLCETHAARWRQRH